MKIITKYLKADLRYNFLNKDDLENEDLTDRPSQRKATTENENENISILSLLEEEIMHLSIDKFYIKFGNLDLSADKENIKDRFISFEINRLKLRINTEIFKERNREKSSKKHNPAKADPIFSIRDITLSFSDITKCVLKNISFEIKKYQNKKESLFDFSIEKIEVKPWLIDKVEKKNQHFFLCPLTNESKEKEGSKEKKKAAVMAVIVKLEIFDSKITRASLELNPVLISLSTQKTNAILQTLNVLIEMNKIEYQLYKKYLKKEVLHSLYKTIIKNSKLDIHENQNIVSNNAFTLLPNPQKNEKDEPPKIKITFNKIFLILTKNEEVLFFKNNRLKKD